MNSHYYKPTEDQKAEIKGRQIVLREKIRVLRAKRDVERVLAQAMKGIAK